MKILISGSSGLIGSVLVPFLSDKGHQVVRLVRAKSIPHPYPLPSREREKGEGWPDVVWDPAAGIMDKSRLEGFDAVIHLAGESIATGRWTVAKKNSIRESRVKGTQLLAEALAHLQQPPKTFLCASAIGYYGDRGNAAIREDSPVGEGFLAEVCRAWETATTPATVKGIRVVNLRLGVVLSRGGGALAKMLLPFKLGVGGKIGSGDQYMSWIALDDVLGAIGHVLNNPVVKGPVNVVAPAAVTNAAYTKALGQVLSRPTIFPMPAFAARLAFGEMADQLLLASQNVEPGVLHKTGYAFRYPELAGALKHLLNR